MVTPNFADEVERHMGIRGEMCGIMEDFQVRVYFRHEYSDITQWEETGCKLIHYSLQGSFSTELALCCHNHDVL